MVNITNYNHVMKTRTALGVILIIASIIGMYLWETRLRENTLYTKVLVAASDIEVGDVAGKDSFKEISVSFESLINGYLTIKDAESLYGKVCIFPLKTNMQVSSDFFEGSEKEWDGAYDLMISREWLFPEDAGLGRGSRVLVYLMPEEKYLGSYVLSGSDTSSCIGLRCPLEDYFVMVNHVFENKNKKLLLVKDEGPWER